LASALRVLAVTRREMGRPAEAEAPAIQCLEIYRRLRSGDDRDLTLALFDLARVREALERLTEAEPLYEQAMAMSESRLPADHPELLTIRNQLAPVYYNLGKIEKATALYEEILKRQLITLGRRHRDTLMTIGNLGVNYAAAGRFVEAIPLLEEAQREGGQYPELGFVGPQMIQVLSDVADPRNPGDIKRVVELARELIGNARDTMPPDSPQLAGLIASCGLGLLAVEVWDEAEALLRECLAIREKVQPDEWKTFNTKSLLGGALLGQKKFAEAEPLLLAGYRGMKAREAAVIQIRGGMRIPQALERLVKLYEAQGDAAEAAAWRAKLDEARAIESRPATREGGR
jgi:tetratricopeptide (TPR) repeat protein